MSWKPCQNCKLAAAIWNFDGENKHHLAISVGDLIVVLEELSGWYRGYLYHYPSKKGIFPVSYVQSMEYDIVSAGEEDYTVPRLDPVALEARESLFDWKERLFEYFATGNRQKYLQILNYMEDLLISRAALIHSHVTHDKLQEMRTRLSAKIDQVNSLCELPLTPRDNTGHAIDPCLKSIGELYNTHHKRQSEVKRKVPQTGWDLKKTKDPVTSKAHHLYLVVRHISHQFPEDCELFLFLFDGDSKKQVSERFLIDVPKGSSGSPQRDHSKTKPPKQHYCIFKDLGAKEMHSNALFLVCQAIRKGKMLLDDKKNISHCQYRRPYAVGVLDLRPALEESSKEQIDDDDDYQMTYTMPLQICVTHEQDFGSLHLSLMKKSGPKSKQSGAMVSMALRFIRGDFLQLKKDFPYLINKNTVLVDKLGFPDVILPGGDRNDIYVTLESGQFEKGSKRAERNVEVAIAVCGKDGRIVTGCIIPAAGSMPLSEYESFIYYHNNQPKWQETFKLSIPSNDINNCHLRIGFRHVAKNEGKDKMEKTFAFAHLKIMKQDGAIFPDGTHELYVYKADSKRWHDPSYYLNFESAKEIGKQGAPTTKTTSRGKTISVDSTSGQSVARSQRETVFISTLTCSTKLTQKVEMLSLLKWRSQSPRDLPAILCNVIYIDGGEIVKFLQDTLDSLFDILANNEQHYGESVFNALVAIFNLLSDEKFSHFIPVLDIYITKHFSATHAYRILLWHFNKRLKEREIGKQSSVINLVKSMQFLFQFIIQSFSLLTSTNRPDQSFFQELNHCFNSMCDLLRSPESRYHGIHAVQSALLRNLPSILPHLSKVYNQRELAGVLAKMIDSVQNDHPSLPGEKMNFIIAVLESDVKLLHPQDSRVTIFPTIVGHLISHMENKMPDNGYRSDEPGNSGCLQCVTKVLEILHYGDELHITFSDTENATPLLRPLLSLCKTFQKSTNPLRGESFMNMIGLLRLMTDNHYAVYFDSLKTGRGSMLKDFIFDLLEVLEVLIKLPPFPSHWVYMSLTLNSVLLRVLKNVAIALFSSFYDDQNFIPQIWDVFFGTCRAFVTQKCLQLELYSDILRAKLIRQFGDVRVTMGKHVAGLWSRLKEKKAPFIPDFIGPFLEMSLLKENELRRVSIPLIFNILMFELKSNGNFKRVETEVFEQMDHLVSRGYGDEAYRDLFFECMMNSCRKEPDLEETEVFVNTVCRLIGLILDYRRVEGNSSHRGQRMGCILNLLNFYKEIDRKELYIRYIYKLAGLHESDGNFTEAGLTLLLHARTLEWSHDMEAAVEGKYPVQSSYQRKELLYMEAIRLHDQGKSWECGILLCKELATVYETQQFNYEKLSKILQTQADFYLKIIRELRVENEYFVVGYFGKGFPLFLRNKVFIHRGQPYERLQNFIKKLTDEFLSAQIYMASEPPGDDIKNSTGMYLQIRKVMPIPDEREEFKGLQIPDKITDYYKTNNVCRFRYDRPFHKGKKDPECEFATLWLERTFYTTDNIFPGVINSFEVCEMKTEELDPLSIARETVSSKVNEIQKLTSEFASNPQMSINPLSMLLKGVIDAAVMGGISNYDKIFFQPSYIQDHPDHKEGVEELRSLIIEQVEVLKQALALHGQRVSDDLKAFHNDLEVRFEAFQDTVFPERKKSTSTPFRKSVNSATSINRPLPPTPTEALIESASFSQTKTPHRRLTGGNPNRLSSFNESSPPSTNNRVKRSHTTKAVRRSTFMASSPERQNTTTESVIDNNSSSSLASSQRDSGIPPEEEEDRGEYETVDFEIQRQYQEKAPAPSYPAPPRPPPAGSGNDFHSYAMIDLEDDDDYEKVNLGKRKESFKTNKVNPEFASPTILRGLPGQKSPSQSPPRRRSFVEKIRGLGQSSSGLAVQTSSSPSVSPPDTHLMPLSFPAKNASPSPSSTSDGEPILEDLDSIRAKLRKSAEDAVKAELDTPPSVQPYGSRHEKSTGQVSRNESASSLLHGKTPGRLPKNEGTPGKFVQMGDYDHLSSLFPQTETEEEIQGTYSYAQQWNEEGPSSSSPTTSRDEVFSSLEFLRSPSHDDTSSKTERAVNHPTPYKSKSPTPEAGSGSNPPPIPRKKTMKSKPTENSDYTSIGTTAATSSSKECESAPTIPSKAPLPRPRSQTMAVDRKSQNYSAPVPVPRKTVPSYSSVEPSSASSVSSSVFASPPPRPPKPSSSLSKDNIDPPAIPPKMKQDAPALPPRTAKAKQDYPQVTPRAGRPSAK